MSIVINDLKCVGCGQCIEGCPGNLIKLKSGKAKIYREKDCWGCTSCLKACRFGAISFYLGPDLGGRGGKLSVEINKNTRKWIVESLDGNRKEIIVNAEESNKY
ncbi:MAG: 4Fe-4S binding protein [Lachnospiraceae bacterium]|nr:4Fe-4S binding protein [Lachnospiraceae bacterium]